MDWGLIGAVVGIVATLIAVFQTWISLQQYRDSKKLPIITDKDELRILRALVTEIEGRDLNIYKNSSFYRPALDSLLNQELIRQKGDKYYLTETGEAVVRKHLADFFKTRRFR
jgi:predicted transcriptional regulator